MVYVCKKCGRRFATRKQVRKHIREEHGVKSGKPYEHEWRGKRRMSPVTMMHTHV